MRTEDDAEDCQLIADAAVAADCVAAAPDFCAPPQTPPMSPGDACAALTTCCATLSDDEDREDCDGVVDAAVASECTATLGELCPTTPTTPTTPDVATCTTLDATCCGKLEDEEDVEECATAARTGDPATCQEAYDALCGEESD